jgi:hypothetical protein
MQLAINDGHYFEGARRTPASTTQTRLEDFLDRALSKEALHESDVSG